MRQYANINISRFNSDNWGGMQSLVATVPITQGSRRKFHLMGEDSITLVFSLAEPKEFKIGDFIRDEVFGLFMLTEKQLPTYNKTTGGYDYQLRFDRAYKLWENHILMLSAPLGDASVDADEEDGTTEMQIHDSNDMWKRQEAIWCLTAPLQQHLEQVLCNLVAAGLNYFGRPYKVRIHSTAKKAKEVRFINYNAAHICSALTTIANEYECEWWVSYETENNVEYGWLNFGKCERNAVARVAEPDGTISDYWMRNGYTQFQSTSTALTLYYKVRKGETWLVRCEGAARSNHVDYALFANIPTSSTSITNSVINSGGSNIEIEISEDGYLAVSGVTTYMPVCKREFEVFTLGDNVETMTASRDMTNYANRLYAFGGTQNVPESYRRHLYLDIDTCESIDGIRCFRDSTRKVNPYTMLLDDGTTVEQMSFQLTALKAENIASGTIAGDNQYVNDATTYPGHSIIRYRSVAHKVGDNSVLAFGFKKDTIVDYSAFSAGVRFFVNAGEATSIRLELKLFLEEYDNPYSDGDTPTNIIYLSDNPFVETDEFSAPTSATEEDIMANFFVSGGKIKLSGGKTYRLVLEGKVEFSIVVGFIYGNERDYIGVTDRSDLCKITFPAGKSFAARVKWENTMYPITFNPSGYVEGEDKAYFFRFDNGTPQGFGLPYDAEVEWLQSDGTAYIDTGITPANDGTKLIKIEAEIETLDGFSGNTAIFGSRVANNDSQFTLQFYIDQVGSGNNYWRFAFGNGAKTTNHNKTNGTFGLSDKSSARTMVISGDHSLTIQCTNSTYSNNYNIYLFAMNNGGSIAGRSNSQYLRIKSFKIYDGSTLLRNYIPVRKDGAGYLYDKVNELLYGNEADTGAFTYGNDVGSVSSDTVQRVELFDYRVDMVESAWYSDNTDDPSSLIGLGDRRLRLPFYKPGTSIPTNGCVEVGNTIEVARVEATINNDNIYPRCYLRVTDVRTESKTDKVVYADGTEYEFPWTAYILQAELIDGSEFPFKRTYVKEGEKLQAMFLSDYDEQKAYEEQDLEWEERIDGYLLAGMTFDVGFREYPCEYTLIRNEDYGAKLPSSVLMPKVGDTFILTGWNVEAMSNLGLVDIAEEQLWNFADSYLDAMQEDGWTFRCNMMSDENGSLLPEGTKVEVMHDALVGGSKVSRIIGYELKLDIPYDSPVYEVGETDAYSRIKQLERKIQKL